MIFNIGHKILNEILLKKNNYFIDLKSITRRFLTPRISDVDLTEPGTNNLIKY
jgi:hypothetical protein